MLLIHKPHSYKKLLTLGIASICGIGALLGLQTLTYAPELSHAETVDSLEHRTMADITYMQDITPSICKNSGLEKQYQLKDSRDQKTYWVAKLRDGNCWMTQNLALILSSSRALTKENSDIEQESWLPSANTGALSSWKGTDSEPQSYNPGLYVYKDPESAYNCGSYNISSLTQCVGWENVAALTASQNGNFLQENSTAVYNGEYDAHYLVGTYYNLYAATAGSLEKGMIDGDSVSSSICPRGWQLPQSGITSAGLNDSNLTFTNLLNIYGWGPWVEADYAPDGYLDSNFTSTTGYSLWRAPFHLSYSGYIYSSGGDNAVGNGRIGHAGANTELHSSTMKYASFTMQSYYFNLAHAGDAGIYPAYHRANAVYGRSVRCVARTEVLPNNVEITINPTISLDVAPEVAVEKSATNPSTANLDVKVSSNQPYSVNINAKSHAELTSSTTEVKIPSANGALNNNTNGWGIKKPEETEYTAVTTTPQLFYQSSVAEIKTIPFIIGISTSPDIPNGEYSTDITITATQN